MDFVLFGAVLEQENTLLIQTIGACADTLSSIGGNMSRDRKFTLRLEEWLIEKLTAEAARRGISVSALVREILWRLYE